MDLMQYQARTGLARAMTLLLAGTSPASPRLGPTTTKRPPNIAFATTNVEDTMQSTLLHMFGGATWGWNGGFFLKTEGF